jgi:hypothetical protein
MPQALIALHRGQFALAREHSTRALSLAEGMMLPTHTAVLGIADLWSGRPDGAPRRTRAEDGDVGSAINNEEVLAMLARLWRGATRAADAEAYVDYLRETGLREYRATRGNQGAWVLWRVLGNRAEFITLSLWESPEAIRRFAGDDIERAVFYPEDDRFLVERGLTVDHYEVEAAPESLPAAS